MGVLITFCHCGTEEMWQKYRENDRYAGMNLIVPGTIYVSETGLCLVTSQEWVDWLTGKTECPPYGEQTQGENRMRHWSDWIPPICCGIGAILFLIAVLICV